MAIFKKYEFIIAWRYLMSKRRQGGISIIAWYALIGVVLGVATLVIVQAVMIGFRTEFVEKIVGANSHLAIYKKTLTTDLDEGYGYDHGFKYNPDGMAAGHGKTDFFSFQWNHLLSKNLFYLLKEIVIKYLILAIEIK